MGLIASGWREGLDPYGVRQVRNPNVTLAAREHRNPGVRDRLLRMR